MVIEPKETEYYIFPYIRFVKVENTLTKEAQKDFGWDWESFIILEIGWLKWNYTLLDLKLKYF